MNTTSTPQDLLNQIAQIQQMERGKLCVMREGPNGPYFNLQCWEKGKNVARYVPRDQAQAVEQAIEGYQKFEELTEQYAEQIIQKTRAELAAGSKKKKPPRPKSSGPKNRKSNS